MRFRCLALLCLAASAMSDVGRAQVADLSGTWVLNKKQSSWGPSVRAFDVILIIQHKEPQLKYKGAITYADEQIREFSYDGAIDGKPQPADRPAGDGTMTHTRLGAREFRTVFRTNDGSYVQTVDTTISRDGRTLTRQLRIETREGVRRWTEVYDRKNIPQSHYRLRPHPIDA